MNRVAKKNIELKNFMTIKIESRLTRTSTTTRKKYYPVLWSKENFMFSRLNYSFIGSISSENFKSEEDFIRMLKIMSDRKSTRLNSSHVRISYAVFCLKKKTYIVLTY